MFSISIVYNASAHHIYVSVEPAGQQICFYLSRKNFYSKQFKIQIKTANSDYFNMNEILPWFNIGTMYISSSIDTKMN